MLRIKHIPFIILLLVCFQAAAQKKATGKPKGTNKHKKFTTPQPVPADHYKEILLQGQQNYVWEFDRDTSFPVAVLFREEIEFEQDSVVFTQYYSKLDMHFYAGRQNVQGKQGNNIYAVYRFKMPYKINYETISILNPRTKKYDDYELKKEAGTIFFDYLLNLTTKRKYKNLSDINVGTNEK